MSSKPVIYYVYDPMCSWCWGFKPVWNALRSRLQDRFEIKYVLGGLAPESHEPMPEEMRESLQKTWQRVSDICGVSFNYDFWTVNEPMRSTYPACKAALVAREHGKELEMYERIQRYYYQEAGNPSVYENLYALAEQLGIEKAGFAHRIHSAEIQARLEAEIMYAESLGAQGFPSVILEWDGQRKLIRHSYTSVDDNLQLIDDAMHA